MMDRRLALQTLIGAIVSQSFTRVTEFRFVLQPDIKIVAEFKGQTVEIDPAELFKALQTEGRTRP